MARSAPTTVKRVLLGVFLLAACGSDPERSVDLMVPAGATVRVVADSLAAHNLISNRSWFRLRARWSHTDRSIKPGIYHLTSSMSGSDILKQLTLGDALSFRITLPEGGTIADLARTAELKLHIPHDSFLSAARDPALLADLRIPGPSAEGWLLPETFDFGGVTSAQEIIRRFVQARHSAWDSTWDRRAAAIGFDQSQLLTLASIVEAEAVHIEEMPTIAAVYRNRLKIGMALQADPTIQYGYLVRDGARKPRLYNKDYDMVSPWNTYRFQGLPPGPIGNPSRAAIEAVLAPTPVKYLYFVAGADGHHRFSITYAEHQRAIRQVRTP